MAETKEKYEYKFKFIIVGNGFVGKSNISYRFVNGKFAEEYKATIGLDFASKIITVNENDIKIEIWDTAGQECFKSISKGYYKNTVCAIVVYDITDRESFNNAISWIEECKNNCAKIVNLILIGNKCDLEQNRVVSTGEGEDLANRFNMKFYETSALTGKNIDKLFFDAAETILKNIENNYYDLSKDECGIGKKKKNIKMNNQQKKKKVCCF